MTAETIAKTFKKPLKSDQLFALSSAVMSTVISSAQTLQSATFTLLILSP